MNHKLIAAIAASLVAAPSYAQVPGEAPTTPKASAIDAAIPAPTAITGTKAIAGVKAGTESWVVNFKSRPFDLLALRAEMYGNRNPEVVAEIVKDLEAKMKAHQKDFCDEVVALGGTVTRQWWIVNAMCIEIAPEKLDTIRAMENVASVDPDLEVFPAIKTATNAANHNSDALNSAGVRGLGVACAIIDTGQDSNMNGTGKPHITYSKAGSTTVTRLVKNLKVGTMSADDVHGHGTGVASVSAGWRWRTAQADQGHAYEANIVGYAIANNTAGSSSTSTMATAYQTAAADAASFRIVATNLSYSGSSNVSDVANRAADSAALNADLLNATASGNNGTNVNSSLTNLNGLSVGAVTENSHTLASFSSRGVQGGRLFPNMCANGVSTDMARRNNETSNYIASGTSMASPQVCGAATLIRGFNRSLKSDETRAIFLASTDASPGTGSGLNSTGPGAGYLQDDVAYTIARTSSMHGRAALSNRTTSWTRNINVKASQRVQIAIAWHRLNVSTTGTTWTNLNMQLRRGTTVLATSTTGTNLEEFIRYTPTATETLNIRVYLTGSVIGGSSQAFGWATYGTVTSVPGTYTLYGSGCGGAAGGTSLVVPKAYTSVSGNSANSFPFGFGHVHYMQVHDKSDFPGATVIRGFELRNRRNFAQNAYTLPMVIRVGHTASASNTLNTTFASNWKGTPTLAFSGNLNVPAFAAQTSPNVWTLKVPFRTPFTYLPSEGNFLWEAQNSRTTTSPTNFFDAVSGTGAKGSRLYNSSSATATTGSRGSNYVVITKLVGAPPVVAAAVVPKGYDATSGNSANSYPFGWYRLRYMQAHANSEFPGVKTFQGMAVRNRRNFAQIAQSRNMLIRVGYTRNNPRALNTTFASNWFGTPATVFSGTLNTPAFPAQTSPKVWTLQVPFSRAVVYNPAVGHFLFEAQNSSTSGRGNYFDAVSSASNPGSRLFNSSSPTAATGSLGAGYTVILQLQETGSGSGVRLTNSGVPNINSSFNINVSNASSGKIAILWLGGTQLNASLGAIAPGCTLYTSLDILLGGVVTNVSGSGSIPFALPNNSSLVGLQFYNQYMVFDSGANTLGLTLSNGGRGKIGG